jgi:uncharacterized protein (TIGR03084 family)
MDPLDALAQQQAELAGLLAGLSDADWSRPSRCEGWTIADVVIHLAQSNDMATGSAQGRFADVVDELMDGLAPAADVDEGADLMVRRERGLSGAEVRARWERSATALREALDAVDPSTRLDWVAGQLSARTLATTRLAETWIHTGDVADGVGVTVAPGNRLQLVARLAWRTVPYAFTRAGRELAGPVRFDLRGPDGEAWDFVPDEPPVTTIRGDGVELCCVAARRVPASETSLQGDGPDADAVLELVRTYA